MYVQHTVSIMLANISYQLIKHGVLYQQVLVNAGLEFQLLTLESIDKKVVGLSSQEFLIYSLLTY